MIGHVLHSPVRVRKTRRGPLKIGTYSRTSPIKILGIMTMRYQKCANFFFWNWSLILAEIHPWPVFSPLRGGPTCQSSFRPTHWKSSCNISKYFSNISRYCCNISELSLNIFLGHLGVIGWDILPQHFKIFFATFQNNLGIFLGKFGSGQTE